MYRDVNNQYVLAMSQKLPVAGFEWKKDKFRYEDFIKISVEDSDQGTFLSYTESTTWVTQQSTIFTRKN